MKPREILVLYSVGEVNQLLMNEWHDLGPNEAFDSIRHLWFYRILDETQAVILPTRWTSEMDHLGLRSLLPAFKQLYHTTRYVHSQLYRGFRLPCDLVQYQTTGISVTGRDLIIRFAVDRHYVHHSSHHRSRF